MTILLIVCLFIFSSLNEHDIFCMFVVFVSVYL